MSDLMNRLRGREPVSFKSYPDTGKEWQEALAKARCENGPLPKVTLPAQSSAPCPKCGSGGISTEYHSGVHPACPDRRMADRGYMYYWPPMSAAMYVMSERQMEAAIEHLDRACCNCKFAWAEATVAKPKRKKAAA